MKIGNIDLNDQVLVIAEIGNNHEGRYELAEEMVGRAAEAGVDVVKFQTFQTDHYTSRDDVARYQRIKSYELSFAQFEKLSERAEKEGVMFVSTPLDLPSANFLKKICPAIKISSGDITFVPLLECIAESGLPVILSTGATNLKAIAYAKAVLERFLESGNDENLALLHCVGAYPTLPEQANIAAIQMLQVRFQCPVGYSDHTLGVEAAVAAVALGACIVEKHFTLDKNQSDFRDHQLSADPAELAQLVEAIRRTEVLMGSGEKFLSDHEVDVAKAVTRSVVAARDLPLGHALGMDDLTWVRKQGGLSPGSEKQILGKCCRRAISSGEALSVELFE